MASTPTDSEHQSVVAQRRGYVSPVVVWLLVLVLAAGAFGAALVYAGGFQGVADMLGSNGAGHDAAGSGGASNPSASTLATTSSDATASAQLGGLPDDALKRMYAEQLQSQASIVALVENRYSSLNIGHAEQDSHTATIPVTAHFRTGGKIAGIMTLRRFDGRWYFFSLQGKNNDSSAEIPADTPFDAAVVQAITSQQATKGNQKAFTDGVLGGGFTRIEPLSVEKGAGTASVRVRFSGGTSKATTGRFVCITKQDSSEQYWFIARLAAN